GSHAVPCQAGRIAATTRHRESARVAEPVAAPSWTADTCAALAAGPRTGFTEGAHPLDPGRQERDDRRLARGRADGTTQKITVRSAVTSCRKQSFPSGSVSTSRGEARNPAPPEPQISTQATQLRRCDHIAYRARSTGGSLRASRTGTAPLPG